MKCGSRRNSTQALRRAVTIHLQQCTEFAVLAFRVRLYDLAISQSLARQSTEKFTHSRLGVSRVRQLALEDNRRAIVADNLPLARLRERAFFISPPRNAPSLKRNALSGRSCLTRFALFRKRPP
jgi:hypothetical protein